MRQIADLHIHSRFSRACSRDLTLPNLDKTCRVKGVDIISTGDFTFPEWIKEIKEELVADKGSSGDGEFYILKNANDNKVKFVLATELALVYKKNDKCRRIHICVQAPNIKAVEELNAYLDKRYNIRSDGRPILGMSAEELMKICLDIHPKFLIYPAHIWTPWFAVFGSKSGFDTMEECFCEYTKDVYAYETGLSSDPEMNWRVSALDKLTLLSNSDAHSLPNIAREANVFELKTSSYDELYDTIIKKSKDSYLDYTIEFYPEEGMYHYDGHRNCGVSFTPQETKKHKGICPRCKKPLVIGVEYRVDELADREAGFKPEGAPGFKKLVELDKIIAEANGIKSRSSKKVKAEYDNITKRFGTEMEILLDKDLKEFEDEINPKIIEGIRRVRNGELTVVPGFDGQYGVVKIFNDNEKDKQKNLFR
jgi:uncharacterized protein (TIGR00375 family)